MSLQHLLVFTTGALFYGIGLRVRWRGWVLMGTSVVALFWLQPSTPIRYLDFWLPVLSLALAIGIWAATLRETYNPNQTLKTALFLTFLITLIALTRYFAPLCCLTPSRPPALPGVLIAILFVTAISSLVARVGRGNPVLLVSAAILVLGFFLIVKSEPLSLSASGWLRRLTGQPQHLADALDLRWLGFSYIAFRLLHVIRDRLAGRLPEITLQEFITYIFFFPALSAGPIDRAQRFVQDLQNTFAFGSKDVLAGGERIVMGMIKKIVIADTLAVVALNETVALQSQATFWLWVFLYAYALQIYFDFSGYTDIAIGLGMLLGIELPENFNRPYLKPNLTQFWNSWHITLAQWFRAYFFNPLTRAMRLSPQKIHPALIILVGQMSTMLFIGLWHGITWNFAIWGIWHAAGLFIHNRWSETMRPRFARWAQRPILQKFLEALGIFLTFHYVTLGWVWFAIPDVNLSWTVLEKLLGFS